MLSCQCYLRTDYFGELYCTYCRFGTAAPWSSGLLSLAFTMSGRQSKVCNVEFVCEFGLFISLLSGTLVLHQHWGKNFKKSTRFSCKLCHGRNWMYLSFDINKFLWCEIQAVSIVHNIQPKGNQTLFSSTFICISITLFTHVTDLWDGLCWDTSSSQLNTS